MRKEIPISEIEDYVGKKVIIIDDENIEREVVLTSIKGYVNGYNKKNSSMIGISPATIKKIYVET
jgi:hypothetical protein